MTKLNHPSVKQLDITSLRGLPSHAETHWLTFATAMRCYAQCPTQPELRRAADRHAPSWLRSALRGPMSSAGPMSGKTARPPELDPKTGSLAFLTQGAEAAMAAPTAKPGSTFTHLGSNEVQHQERLERYLAAAAARADVTRRHG